MRCSGRSSPATTAVGRRAPWAGVAVLLAFLVPSCGDEVTKTLNPTPGIEALTPAGAVQGDPGFTLTVIGSDFVASSVVRWNGSDRVTTYITERELRAAILATDLESGGVALVTVFTPPPGGGTSNTATFAIQERDNPTPQLTALSPTGVDVGAGESIVTISGTGFMVASRARLDNAERPTTYVSGTEVRMTLPAGDLATVGTRTVTVVNPAPGGGPSNPLTFEVRSPVPTITGLVPAETTAGQPEFELVVNGTGFYPGSEVRFNGAPRTTTYVGPTELSVTLLEGDIAGAGTFEITVVNGPPGGGTSPGVPFRVINGVPVIDFLPSLGASAGLPGFSLTVHGVGFVSTSVVQWNGVDRPTTYVGGTRLTAAVSAADVATAGTADVTVFTPAPGGGLSRSVTLTMRNVAPPAITRRIDVALRANDLVYDPNTGELYASVPSTVPALGNTVVAIDPATGSVTRSVFAGSEPAVLALSDDGRYLYVSLEGSGSVRRVDAASFTAGLEFSLGTGLVEEMWIMPGVPQTVALSKKNPFISPRHLGVFVYDDGVQRPVAAPGHTGSNSINFGESAAILYGYNNETTEFGFRTMAVDPDGVRVTKVTGGLLSGFTLRTRYANGRVYGSNGAIVDGGRHVRVGSFAGSGASVLPDAELGRAYIIDGGTITAFDLNHFQPLGNVFVSGVVPEHPALSRLRLVRWGIDGLAFRDGTTIFILRTTLSSP